MPGESQTLFKIFKPPCEVVNTYSVLTHLVNISFVMPRPRPKIEAGYIKHRLLPLSSVDRKLFQSLHLQREDLLLIPKMNFLYEITHQNSN